MATFSHWQFVEFQDVAGRRWIWQRIAIDGTIEHRSPDYPDYGAAVYHAITDGGFRPKYQSWTIITSHSVTHFKPDKPEEASQLPRKKRMKAAKA